MDKELLMRKISEGMKRGIDLAVGKDIDTIKNFIDQQKKLHPEISNDPEALADRIIRKKQWYAGAVGFFWGLGGIITVVPNVAHIWRIHGRLVLSIAYILSLIHI